METLKLVEGISHPIVECHDLECIIPDDVNFTIAESYTTSEGKHRHLYSVGLNGKLSTYFHGLIYQKIVPLLFADKTFFHTWPVTPKTIFKNTDLNLSIFKDDIGWSQGLHEDPKVFLLSGVVHLQDCEQGTTFIDSHNNITYTAPTKKFSGAFWLNAHGARHYVDKVTKERMGYLIVMPWKCFEPYNFAGNHFGATASNTINFRDFYQ